MVWTAIWDAQNGLIQIWRTGGELIHKNDQIHVWCEQPPGMPKIVQEGGRPGNPFATHRIVPDGVFGIRVSCMVRTTIWDV